jgi:hypothetical protein
MLDVAVWDAKGGTQLYRNREASAGRPPNTLGFASTQSLAWSPDGSRLLVANTSGDAALTVRDAATGEMKLTLDLADRGGTVATNATPAYSPNGRRIACLVRTRAGDEVVKLWEADNGKELLVLHPPPTDFSGVRGHRGFCSPPTATASSSAPKPREIGRMMQRGSGVRSAYRRGTRPRARSGSSRNRRGAATEQPASHTATVPAVAPFGRSGHNAAPPGCRLTAVGRGLFGRRDNPWPHDREPHRYCLCNLARPALVPRGPGGRGRS